MQDNRPTILLVDNDERVFRSMSLLLQNQYRFFATKDCFAALKILRREKVNVIMMDQRLPILSGKELLRQARYIAPTATRILLTGYVEAQAVDSSHDSDIFCYLSRPLNDEEMHAKLALAVEKSRELETKPTVPAFQRPPKLTEEVDLGEQDNKRVLCLVLDQDEMTFRTIQEILEPQHEVIWCQDIQSAQSILEQRTVAVLVTELALDNQDIRGMFDSFEKKHVSLLTIVLTQQMDISFLSELVTKGQVYRYLPKPLRRGIIQKILESTISQYHERRANAEAPQPSRVRTGLALRQN